MMPEIQRSNPQIQSLDQLKPGQILHIPGLKQKVEIKKEPVQVPTPKTSQSAIQKAYIVRAGDTLVSIMQQHGIPKNLIYSKYMKLFQDANPDIRKIDSLRPGQSVIIPPPEQAELRGAGHASSETRALPGNGSANATGAAQSGAITPESAWTQGQFAQIPLIPGPFPGSAIPPIIPPQSTTLPPTPDHAENATDIPEAKVPTTGLPYIQNILKEMRFSFAPGDEELYPLPNDGWLQVKLKETPLLTTPWGERVLLCPVPKNSEWIAKANKLNMQVCSISADWSLPGILAKLAEKFPDQIRIWDPGTDLSLSRNGLGITLRSPNMAIIQYRGQKMVYALWGRQIPDERALPQDLPEVLGDMQIKVIETDQFNDVCRLPTRPKQSIFVPVAERTELIRALAPDDPEQLFGPTLPQDLNELLRLLKSKDKLRQGFASLDWSGGSNRHIALQVPAWIIEPISRKVILLDKKFADEYLVSLLTHAGYTCFVLPD